MDDHFLDEERADEPRKVWGLAVAILAILAAAALLYYFVFMKRTKPPAEPEKKDEKAPEKK